MSETASAFYWLRSSGEKAPGQPWLALSDAVYREQPANTPEYGKLLGTAPDWAYDLQSLARAVFAADKFSYRNTTFSRWTRRLTLSVPVTEPQRWERARPHLMALLEIMTGDRWEFEFRSTAPGSPRAQTMTYPHDYEEERTRGSTPLRRPRLPELGPPPHRYPAGPHTSLRHLSGEQLRVVAEKGLLSGQGRLPEQVCVNTLSSELPGLIAVHRASARW
jgi:hypothetical protein